MTACLRCGNDIEDPLPDQELCEECIYNTEYSEDGLSEEDKLNA